jgi:hypothetical protein
MRKILIKERHKNVKSWWLKGHKWKKQRRNKTEGKTHIKDRKIENKIPCFLVLVVEPPIKENVIEIIVSSND